MSSHLSKQRISWIVLGVALVATLGWGAAHVWSSWIEVDGSRKVPNVEGVEFLRSGFRLTNALSCSEEVSALQVTDATESNANSYIYVGTAPRGTVLRFSPAGDTRSSQTIAESMGDSVHAGTCNVNALAIVDVDRDGAPELLASTSQVTPRGRPRLYMWTLGFPVSLREVVRPEIRSSWSHGLGWMPGQGGANSSLLITYCGFGEIVEFQFDRRADDGFRAESLRWKQVDQLPASGEWLQTSDVDNDGETDLCVATGYAEKKAAISIHERRPDGTFRRKLTIDEDGRFGNVHFIVGDLAGEGENELIAWWCSEIDGGAVEMIRYRVESGGVVEREVVERGRAEEILPRDGQMTLFDEDRDGRAELWFATRSGSVYRWTRVEGTRPELMVRIKAGVGPICAFDRETIKLGRGLYFGAGTEVIRLEREGEK